MPSTVLFFSLAIALCMVLALIVLVPWFRQRAMTDDDQLLTLNVEVFKQRLNELAQDYNDGTIDQVTYASQKLALERQLLDINHNTQTANFRPTWKSRLIFLVWIPLLTIMAYTLISNRTPVYKLWQAQDSVGQVADDLLTGKIEAPPDWATKDGTALLSAMQTNVYRHADDPQRWFRLAQIFVALQSPESALEAFARAYRLNPDDQQVAIAYAQTSFFAQNGQLNATIRPILTHLLQQDPQHQGAQMLMAMGEMRADNYAQARYWVNLLKSEIAQKSGDHTQALQSLNDLTKNIDEREQQSKQAVTIVLDITPEMLGQIKKGDTLFISVKDINGGPPVAAKKTNTDNLGKQGSSVALSDNDSIMPTQKLSQAIASGKSLAVTARVSRSGNATPQSGDITSNPVPLDAKAGSTTVLINKIVP